jgi:leucyl-tRNA synthetase
MVVDWNKIQDKWQKKWKDTELGKAKVESNKEKFMMIFAYPGVSGYLHVGHMRGFSYTDAICRYQRLKGKEVLFPVGTHASGNQALGFANKVKNKDKDWINYLKNNGCSEEQISQLVDPKKVVDYFNQVYINDYWKKFGFICDWDRFTSTTHKDYEKFIQWQFKKLQQKDLLIQKPYFATACINCGPVAVDPSETDIAKGGNAEKNEYTLLKFQYGEDYLIAATLRPETIYGQTNLWINPNAEYVRVQVESENWIISKEAAEKLKYQKDDVILKEDIKPEQFIGRFALAPGINREIIILPAKFCDPKIGSGIVTSVPSDAPYDYIALKELQANKEMISEFNLDEQEVKDIKLIPIIKSKGYGDFPAKEIVERMNIKSLEDPKLEEATKEIYKAGFHTGVMTEICGKYSGKRVEEAKELMKVELLEKGKADVFYDLSEEVICRCGEQVIIKRIDDQWFIRYSDAELTERSKEQVTEMKIYPKEYQDNMPSVLDWFSDRACARLGNWLGSKLPFDEKWTVEPISDSTLYPIFYIVSKFTNSGKLKVNDLTEEFFDYVFLGKGDGKESWKEVKKEFDYFYPLDINLGGKEHKTVHFPVFLMNHVAILPEEKWPKGIFVNWWVTGKGSKISKSKGGAVPIPEAVEKYGVDAMRLYYSHIGSPHIDVVWIEETVFSYKSTLERIYNLVEEIKELDDKKMSVDSWLISKLNENIKKMNHQMKEYNLRELTSTVYFAMYDDLRWYLRRGGENKKTIVEYLESWFKLMNPVTPHLSEELNVLINGSKAKLISSSSWPEHNEESISHKANSGEELVRTAIEGMRNVLKFAKLEKVQKYTLFVAEKWLYELFNTVSSEIKVTRNLGEIMRVVLEKEEMKVKGKEISKIVQSLVKDVSKIPIMITSQEEELAVMKEAKSFLEKEFSCTVEIVNGDESEETKAKQAMPGKVGILVE